MANLRLRRLKIEKFRNVVPGTELIFGDGMNVLLGRNGTGKTTLLQLIAMITGSNLGKLADEELEIEYDLSLLGRLFRVELANQASLSSQSRTFRRWSTSEGRQTEWSFRVSLLSRGEEHVLLSGSPRNTTIVRGLEPALPTPALNPFYSAGPMTQTVHVLLALTNLPEAQGAAAQQEAEAARFQWLRGFAQRAIEFQQEVSQHGGRFDEGLGIFGGIVNGMAALSVDDAKVAALLYDAKEDLVKGHFVPDELISAAAHHIRSSGMADISLSDGELPFLRRALDLIGGEQGTMLLELQRKKSPEDGGDATFGDFEFLITMEDGSVFRHDYLSYGQKRLLSFLYYAAANPDIIIADELVNGLHHEWIDACLDEVKDRQCFLTSQNPLLLDYLSFDSVEEVERTFLLCDRRKEGKRTQLVWQHMDRESAESFFRAYRAGVQHVSEILRTKGLW